jgi:hypothetical protein
LPLALLLLAVALLLPVDTVQFDESNAGVIDKIPSLFADDGPALPAVMAPPAAKVGKPMLAMMAAVAAACPAFCAMA